MAQDGKCKDTRCGGLGGVVRDGNGQSEAASELKVDNVISPEHAEMLLTKMAVEFCVELYLEGDNIIG
ncbi:hypothetical protein ACH5RR_018236 [Cinchona calisaya]|uniref:RNase H type-1 domain-containing protein n=1 Tax=Cinchona calisaya TaxID=153742 RepID=A0ABD2ZNR2_9GENT